MHHKPPHQPDPPPSHPTANWVDLWLANDPAAFGPIRAIGALPDPYRRVYDGIGAYIGEGGTFPAGAPNIARDFRRPIVDAWIQGQDVNGVSLSIIFDAADRARTQPAE